MRKRHRERERQRHRQREKQAPCREPNVGLDPRSPGSRPGPKVVLNCWATQAALSCVSYLSDPAGAEDGSMTRVIWSKKFTVRALTKFEIPPNVLVL